MNRSIEHIAEWKRHPLKDLLVTKGGEVYSMRSNTFLSKCPTKKGYIRNSNGFVHRQVAYTYIPNPDNKPHVNHKNGVIYDNYVENLEWCTPKENMQHAFQTGLATKTPKGKDNKLFGKFNNHFAKPVLQIALDGTMVKRWNSAHDFKRETGKSNKHISSCALGQRRTAYGFKWQYENA